MSKNDAANFNFLQQSCRKCTRVRYNKGEVLAYHALVEGGYKPGLTRPLFTYDRCYLCAHR